MFADARNKLRSTWLT